jgi:hypothetical protein
VISTFPSFRFGWIRRIIIFDIAVQENISPNSKSIPDQSRSFFDLTVDQFLIDFLLHVAAGLGTGGWGCG